MDATTQAYLMPMIVLAVGLFAGGMYYYRKYTAGETFNAQKFLETLGLGALAGFALYVASSAVPDINTIITQIESLAPGGTISASACLAALLAVWNWFTKFLASNSTASTNTAATQAATTEQAKASLEAATGTTPAYAAGKGTILGIYGGSASGATPAASFTVDINQIPEMFADIQCLVTGKIMLAIKIDGVLLKDCEELGLDLKTVGAKYPIAFWIPQKYRTAGTHIITIQTGHLEGQQSIAAGGSDSKVVYDGAQDFGLTFTGTKKE